MQTKLHPPPALPLAVARPRLDALLTEVLRHPVTLVAAPAGSGKTTLASNWTRLVPPEVTIAWLSLDEADSDPGRFGRYVVEALRRVVPCGDVAIALLRASATPDLEQVFASLVNDLAGADREVLFVLDDYHAIRSEAAHDALRFLVAHLPASVHLVITSRSEPPLPLARMRARQQLFEVDPTQLQFTGDEADAYLNAAHGLGLARDDVDTLNRAVEGWAAGLQLAAIDSRSGRTASSPRSSQRAHPGAFEYLAGEVFDAQDGAVQEFLVRTSIVDRISPSLADALTDDQDSDARLEALRGDHLFTSLIDPGVPLYRYHHLFQEFLRQRLRQVHPELESELHTRAARWFLHERSGDEALAHAEASGDRSLVIEVLEDILTDAVMRGEVTAAERWFRAATTEEAILHPGIALPRATLEFLHLRARESERWLEHAERAIEAMPAIPSTDRAKREWAGHALFVRAFISHLHGDAEAARAACREGFAILPQDSDRARWLAYVDGLVTFSERGEEDSTTSFERAVEGCWETGFYGGALSGLGFIAFLRIAQGRLAEAEAIARDGLERIRSIGLVPAAAALERALAEVCLERNELERAERHASRSRELDPSGVFCAIVSPPEHVHITTAIRRGDVESAHALFRSMGGAVTDETPGPDGRTRGRTSLAQIAAMLGEGEVAEGWAERLHATGVEEPGYRNENRQTLHARLLLANGKPRDAASVLRRVASSAGPAGRHGRELKALTLLAVACLESGDEAAARKATERALALAGTEGAIGPFLDAGEPMLALLARYFASDPTAATILAAAAPQQLSPDAAPLSDRELEVLRLLSSGRSNPQIASELFVSPETVKTHVRNIYRKLEVGNRLEADRRARELRLL